jgi:hypothetical protein|tara:strand:- start:134 stop:340 length:207 start_codon:yes stop_codon:yes gene_type:complete
MKKLSAIILSFVLAFISYNVISLLTTITPTIETFGQGVAMALLWGFILSLIGVVGYMILCLINNNFNN